MIDLSGNVAIVTGGARGIGKAIAQGLADLKATVVVADLSGEDAETAALHLVEQGRSAKGVAVDVANGASVADMVRTVIDQQGRLDILCSNAGIFPSARIDTMSESEWDRVQAVNLKGTFLCVQACLPHMRRQRRGRIVVTSSITGPITGYPGWAHYGASKAGLMGFIRSAAIELAPDGITINAVLPGNIMTEGMQSVGTEYIRETERSIPMGKLGEPADVAHAVAFLASDAARYITGQGLVIDGGQTLPESRLAVR